MNLVDELQVSAERDDVLTVLRKTKRLASKLGRTDISEWLQWEEAGYPGSQTVPEYRQMGTTLAYDTNGYVPAGFGFVMNGIEDLTGFDVPERYQLRAPISEVSSLIESLGGGKCIYLPVVAGSEYDRLLRACVHFHPLFARQITLLTKLNSAQVKAIPDRIKDKVLDWACKLEAAGVTGEGMTFSVEERRIAGGVTFNIFGSHIEQLNNHGANHREPK